MELINSMKSFALILIIMPLEMMQESIGFAIQFINTEKWEAWPQLEKKAEVLEKKVIKTPKSDHLLKLTTKEEIKFHFLDIDDSIFKL